MSRYKVIIKEEAQVVNLKADGVAKSQRNIDLSIEFSKQKSMWMYYLPMGIMATNNCIR